MVEQPDGPLFFTGNDPLSVAADLLNTVDLLATPADRLTEPAHLRAFLAGHDLPEAPLADRDLEGVRRAREQLRAVWQSPDRVTAADRLNTVAGRHTPSPRVVGDGGTWQVRYGDRAAPARAVVDEILGALAHEIATHGVARLGTCAGDPCRCVFLDRSRNRSRRYCCEFCTNRAASSAYRRRARAGRSAQ